MVRLIGVTRTVECSHVVFCLSDELFYKPSLEALGIRVVSFNMPRGKISLLATIRLLRSIYEERADIVQSWMYHANLLGGGLAVLAGQAFPVWGVHHAALDKVRMKRSTRWVARIGGPLSYLIPGVIVSCSEKARENHVAMGYTAAGFVTIENGYDLELFRQDKGARDSSRRELGIEGNTILIGMIGRWDPIKDHGNFLRAASKVKAMPGRVKFLLCGEGVSIQNSSLRAMIEENCLTDQVVVLGLRKDIVRIINALDFSVLSSASEAFPNVVAESMACQVPCIVTDVGDARKIVGDYGWVVAPKDDRALARAMNEAIETPKSILLTMGQNARRRIAAEFSLQRMAAKYKDVWRSMADRYEY